MSATASSTTRRSSTTAYCPPQRVQSPWGAGRCGQHDTADAFDVLIAGDHVDAVRRHEGRAVSHPVEFESLLAMVAATLSNPHTGGVDDVIREAQRQVVEALALDRCDLFQPSEGSGALVLTHTWARSEVTTPTTRSLVTERVPHMTARIRRGETVSFTRVDELPSPDREAIAQQGTRSNVTMPLGVGGRLLGALAVDALREERRWPPDLIRRVGLFGELFANALARLHANRELRGALAEVQRLRDRRRSEPECLPREATPFAGRWQIVGSSRAIRSALDQVDQVAPTTATVLLQGETGTGKELFAAQVHELSPRRGRPMVRVNCSAIPAALIESELFGREKGAYTGALARQAGRFEVADKSTLFLDEIGELTLEMQVKLLHVLQERQIERLGSTRPIDIDIRIIAATNRDLEKAVAQGTFREDLYYRLHVFPIRVPPLRERPDDIPSLVWGFIDEFSRTFGKQIDSVQKNDMLALQHYHWPGNVRELRNVVERAVIVATGPRLTIELPRAAAVAIGGQAPGSTALADIERDHIILVLNRSKWRIRGPAGAADLLGLKATTLESRMARLGIRRPQA